MVPFPLCRLCFHTFQNAIVAFEVIIPHLSNVLDLSPVVIIFDALGNFSTRRVTFHRQIFCNNLSFIGTKIVCVTG